jgi:hypothetical protein
VFIENLLTRINPPDKGGQAGNSKLQISNTKQITITEIQNPKRENDGEAQSLIQEGSELNFFHQFLKIKMI